MQYVVAVSYCVVTNKSYLIICPFTTRTRKILFQMTIYGQVSVALLLNWVAISFEVLLALADIPAIGLTFNPNKKI